MSYPTKEFSPLKLEDYRRVMMDRLSEEELFTTAHIANCMKKGSHTQIPFMAQNIPGRESFFKLEKIFQVHKCVAGGGKALLMALTGVLNAR
ncbi:unnamed protein product [Arabis nemorensis]|uniref:Uncharacterized protein n=1 Tax=Arabis nemorensis TaxID=586526 RepID=A0A565BR04_9BRAS|nr:unnamed protein product [Arabis nemorensis]